MSTKPIPITLYLLHTDTDSNGSQLDCYLTARKRDEALLAAFTTKGGKSWRRGVALLDTDTEEAAGAFDALICDLCDTADSWSRTDVELDVANLPAVVAALAAAKEGVAS